MKIMLTSFIATLLLLSFKASASPVIVILDGVRHQCTPIGNGNGNIVQCIETAYRGIFSRSESERICAGAFDESPALCALEAYKGILSREESIDLCIGALSEGPATCVKVAYAGPFSRDESIRLCRRTGTERIAVCALETYRGPYSKEQAIEMCKARSFNDGSLTPRLSLKSKSLKTDISKDDLDLLIKEVNTKAVERNEYK
jgi:hypothetical protein